MSFFSKPKLSASVVMGILGQLVLNSIEPGSIEKYQELMSSLINEDQKKEILFFDLFAKSMAVQKILTGSPYQKEIAQGLIAHISNVVYKSDSERSDFSKLFRERESIYGKILKSGDMMSFGSCFFNYLNGEIPEIPDNGRIRGGTLQQGLMLVALYTAAQLSAEGALKDVLKYGITA